MSGAHKAKPYVQMCWCWDGVVCNCPLCACSLPLAGTLLYRARFTFFLCSLHDARSAWALPSSTEWPVVRTTSFWCYHCSSWPADVDKINKKLLTRRFTKTGAGQSKKPPAVWCSRGTPASEIVASHLASMREALTPSGWC